MKTSNAAAFMWRQESVTDGLCRAKDEGWTRAMKAPLLRQFPRPIIPDSVATRLHGSGLLILIGRNVRTTLVVSQK